MRNVARRDEKNPLRRFAVNLHSVYVAQSPVQLDKKTQSAVYQVATAACVWPHSKSQRFRILFHLSVTRRSRPCLHRGIVLLQHVVFSLFIFPYTSEINYEWTKAY